MYKYLILITIMLGMYGCITINEAVAPRNMAQLYNPSRSNLKPDLSVYHNSDTSSMLMVKINPDELFFVANEKNRLIARLLIQYKLYPDMGLNQLLDSATVRYQLTKSEKSNDFIAFIPVKIRTEDDFILQVNAIDEHRNTLTEYYVKIDKKNKTNRQNYKIVRKNDYAPLFGQHVQASDSFRIQKPVGNSIPLFVSYYNYDFPLAPPPFYLERQTNITLRADSVRYITNPESGNLSFPQYGLYHLQSDTSELGGFILTNFGNFFPEIRESEKLLPPLRYLTSNKEYEGLLAINDPKKATDSFWLTAGGTEERASELVRVFYNRVKFANKYFSSFTEGWRSDRGMIYIIMGAPTYVHRYADRERWIYGNKLSSKTLEFVFFKIDNPFTEEYYILKRSIEYKQDWYAAVESWRNGKIYTFGR